MANAIDGIGQLKTSGRPVIGCFPLYPPLELLHSMGLAPVVLWGLRDSVPNVREADRHVQGYACSVARQLTQFVLDDGRGLFDGLFFYNACDTLRNLPEILRAGLESGGGELPTFRVHVPMVPAVQTDASAYLASEIDNLVGSLEEAYDVEYSEDAFAESVSLYRLMRWLSSRLEEAVSEGSMTFADFCAVMTETNFMSVEDQIARLESALAAASPISPAAASLPKKAPLGSDPSGAFLSARAGRVIVSGILPPPALICEVIDRADLRVAGNDIASMFRSYAHTPDFWSSAGDYYVRFYRDHFPCTTLLYTADSRPRAIAGLMSEKQADAFVFVGEKFCEYEYFEMPFLEQGFRESETPVLSLEISIEDDSTAETFRTRIEAFAEMLAARPAGRAKSEQEK